MGSPYLSDDINANIAQSERDGGVWEKDVPLDATVVVETQNNVYRFCKREGDEWLAEGGRFTQPTVVGINGSTWGGSMLKVGFFGVGMNLEMRQDGRTITTSAIKSVRVEATT